MAEISKISSQQSKHIKSLKINKLMFGKCLECLGLFGKCIQFPKQSQHFKIQSIENQRFGCLESFCPVFVKFRAMYYTKNELRRIISACKDFDELSFACILITDIYPVTGVSLAERNTHRRIHEFVRKISLTRVKQIRHDNK